VDFTLASFSCLIVVSVSLLRIPRSQRREENYLRLVGLLVSGLGML